jgi:hypothetical protein
MKRVLSVAALALATFAAGVAVARAEFGWTRLSAPCAPTGVALNAQEIAVICPDDRTVYLRLR